MTCNTLQGWQTNALANSPKIYPPPPPPNTEALCHPPPPPPQGMSASAVAQEENEILEEMGHGRPGTSPMVGEAMDRRVLVDDDAEEVEEEGVQGDDGDECHAVLSDAGEQAHRGAQSPDGSLAWNVDNDQVYC